MPPKKARPEQRQKRPEWIGGRRRFPAYIQEPEPIRPDIIIWMDRDSLYLIDMEAIPPNTPNSALVDHFQRALANPRTAGKRPASLCVAEPSDAALLREHLGGEFEIRVAPTPEIDEVISRFVDYANPGVMPSYFGNRIPPAAVDRLFRAAEDLYHSAPWDVVGGEDNLLLLDAPHFGLIGASISIIGALGEHRGLLIYESLASCLQMKRQAQHFSSMGTSPRRSELCTPAMSVTFNNAADVPARMLQEARENEWHPAAPDAYPIVLAFDPDNVVRPLGRHDCELATACCLAVSRLASRLSADGTLASRAGQETVVIETIPGSPVVTVALPLPGLGMDTGDADEHSFPPN